ELVHALLELAGEKTRKLLQAAVRAEGFARVAVYEENAVVGFLEKKLEEFPALQGALASRDHLQIRLQLAGGVHAALLRKADALSKSFCTRSTMAFTSASERPSGSRRAELTRPPEASPE